MGFAHAVAPFDISSLLSAGHSIADQARSPGITAATSLRRDRCRVSTTPRLHCGTAVAVDIRPDRTSAFDTFPSDLQASKRERPRADICRARAQTFDLQRQGHRHPADGERGPCRGTRCLGKRDDHAKEGQVAFSGFPGVSSFPFFWNALLALCPLTSASLSDTHPFAMDRCTDSPLVPKSTSTILTLHLI